MLIDGALVAADATIDVVNPATGEPFAACPDASAADLDRAVAAARRAFPGWAATDIAERARLIGKAADAIEAAADELAALFTREQGRPTHFAREEIVGGAQWLRAITTMAIPVEVSEDSETRRVETRYEPLGVVCAIVPWNFPILLACWKIGPALFTGNTLVLKPSPFTPLCALRIGELFRDIFPAGVINIISGGDALGPKMTAHPGFAKISFTGSTATGKRVMESAARDLKRITLELGGNDAAIVMPDVDLDAVAQKIFFGAFFNSAQICVATKRLYVHEAIYDALRDRLHQIAQHAPIGDGSEQGTLFGPIQNAPQYLRVRELIDDARASGLTLLQGADVPAQGYFIPLTIVDNPPEDARVVREEAFGPVLPMMRFTEVEDVIARANDSDYGLAGAVWSADIDAAVGIARRLETGTVWINENLNSTPFTPFGGAKQSGFGVEGGVAGLLEYMQPRTLFIPKVAATTAG
jgi:acyl-CoA reductase-like NAD-dependent aldehyde dehydrogenase